MAYNPTNEEIKSAMYYCRDFDSCNLNCPFHNKTIDCASIISRYALEQFRLKSETIASLQISRDNLYNEMIERQKEEIDIAKRMSRKQTINEVVKKLKENHIISSLNSIGEQVVKLEVIENLIEEE